MKRFTIKELQNMRESEDHVEFKRGDRGNISYNGAHKDTPKDRRRCILGYVVALCNEKGGRLVIGMHDDFPHQVMGTQQAENAMGQLESDIYRDLGIRPDIYELFDENNKRVLVIEVPSRPAGKVYKYEDVALMRVGEELKPMDDKTFLSIIQEQEPDFSEQYCFGATMDDLDMNAVKIMKEKYARKQNNPSFLSISDVQALSDLKLISNGKVTNAAILLVGKESSIEHFFPQAKVMLEYRKTEPQIEFNRRFVFGQPFFILIDKLWDTINLYNDSVPIREGAYIFDIPYFNEMVIRELINNAFAHRDYRKNSEIVIKLYPARMDVINAGGFPYGVTLENLLTVPSTPRNRLLADVLAKTGVVERSGQGIDKIFLNTLAEGKAEPNYSYSDDFQVVAVLYATIKDAGFASFVQNIQQGLADDEKLTVFDMMALCKIRDGERKDIDKGIAKRLLDKKCIEKHGKTSGQYYTLPRRYYEMIGKEVDYSMLVDWNGEQILAVLVPYLKKYGKAKKSDIVKLVGDHSSEKQLRKYLEQFKNSGIIKVEGEKRYTFYMLTDEYIQSNEIRAKAIQIGMQAMKDSGEIQ